MTCCWAACFFVKRALLAYQTYSSLWQCVSLRVVEGSSGSVCPCFPPELPVGIMSFIPRCALVQHAAECTFPAIWQVCISWSVHFRLSFSCMHDAFTWCPTDINYRRATTTLLAGTAGDSSKQRGYVGRHLMQSGQTTFLLPAFH